MTPCSSVTKQSGADRRGRPLRAWLRRCHRWLGLVAIFFVVTLGATGIALNHSAEWQLDRRYIAWNWVNNALGIRAPAPTASFADGRHRVTQLGPRAYFDRIEIPYPIESLTGFVVIDPLALLSTSDAVIVLTIDGDVVEYMDMRGRLPAGIDRVGKLDGRVVLESAGLLLVGDTDMAGFATADANVGQPAWSRTSEPDDDLVELLQSLYRGQGVTVERFLMEIHSGRIVGRAGRALLDLAGIVLIVLGISGLIVWRWGRRRANGSGQR